MKNIFVKSSNTMSAMRKLLVNRKGIALTEYAMLVTFILLGVWVAVSQYGSWLYNHFIYMSQNW